MEARDPKANRPRASEPGAANRPAAGLGKPATRLVESRPDSRPRPQFVPVGRIAPRPVTRPMPVLPRSQPALVPRLPALPRSGFGLPNLRRNVCPHFYMTGCRGAIPIQAPHLLKALIRQEQNVSRCQLRGGVHLEQGYVNDVCLTPRFNQCVFYEDELTKD